MLNLPLFLSSKFKFHVKKKGKIWTRLARTFEKLKKPILSRKKSKKSHFSSKLLIKFAYWLHYHHNSNSNSFSILIWSSSYSQCCVIRLTINTVLFIAHKKGFIQSLGRDFNDWLACKGLFSKNHQR